MIVRCAYDDLIPVTDLKPHPKNRNKHPENQIQRLAEILKYQGFRYPVKVSKLTGFITSGHGRIEAAKLNGWTTVPVNYQDYDDEAQEYADVQADNAIASWAELDLSAINTDLPEFGPDFDIDMLGIKNFEIEPAEMAGDPDLVPELPKEPKSKIGDIYRLGAHRLMCGDSTDPFSVSRLIDGADIGLIFTDPPYGIAYQDVKKSHRKIENDEAQDGIQALLVQLFTFDCPIFICCNWKCYSTFEKAMTEAGRPVKSCIVWDKLSRVQNLDKFGKQHEFILYSGPFGGEKTVDVDIWQCKRQVLTEHPTAKPTELIERAIGHFEARNVLDLFGGSGSVLIAAEDQKRSSYLMELDPRYCDVIIKRWESYTGQKAELVNG